MRNVKIRTLNNNYLSNEEITNKRRNTYQNNKYLSNEEKVMFLFYEEWFKLFFLYVVA